MQIRLSQEFLVMNCLWNDNPSQHLVEIFREQLIRPRDADQKTRKHIMGPKISYNHYQASRSDNWPTIRTYLASALFTGWIMWRKVIITITITIKPAYQIKLANICGLRLAQWLEATKREAIEASQCQSVGWQPFVVSTKTKNKQPQPNLNNLSVYALTTPSVNCSTSPSLCLLHQK